MEDQPLPADMSPTALSLGYVVDSDPEKDEKDPKEDPVDYPADRGNNDDDDLRHYKSECPKVKFHIRVDMIHGRMRASKPKTMQDAIEIVIKLRNKKISTLAECQTENKKRLDNTSKNNQNQRQPKKRQTTGKAYTARHGEKQHYNGSKPLCSKCNYHHDGPCAPKCHQCNRFGHLARDLRRVVHAFGGGESEQDLNNTEDEIEA
nr:hypothetical protein [Tanacetum cinerariifolium]